MSGLITPSLEEIAYVASELQRVDYFRSRKLPLMLSVLWFSIFAFLSGFSTSYAMLFGLRALFGLGMGGEWAAGMPLVLEMRPKFELPSDVFGLAKFAVLVRL